MKGKSAHAAEVAEIVRNLSTDLEQIYRQNDSDVNVVVTPLANGSRSRTEPDRATLIWRAKHWIALIAVVAATITFGISHLIPATYSS